VKEDVLQEGLPVPDEAVVRERVLGANVGAPDHVTVKDFLRWHAAISSGQDRGKSNLRLAQHDSGVVLRRLQPCDRYANT
jgi:hypothetical protein